MTALICQSIGWPYMLAVITAIVTIEPTAADSIKKAFIRFPASAIGAAFAMLYTFLLGVTPLTYMLVAVSTIISCSKLRLHTGTLVATLTGVAMLTIVHDHYFISFLIRLATTSIGLLTSSLVNIIVLPPNYTPIITRKIQNLSKQMSSVL
ncbi:aromatic acid exporter family protein [Priestia megaterium]|uniref:aromatic acid exporter family protein n=1 Tax=Priestia megaterium TaxID=1404 RepID=UPI0035C98415